MIDAVSKLMTTVLLMGWCTLSSANQTVTLGISNATEGGSTELGTALNRGAALYFDNHNKNARVRFEMVKLNDGYEPDYTVANTKQFLTDVEPLALFNYVGTPTTHAILPMLKQFNIPLITPFTGANFGNNKKEDRVFTLRASYQLEAATQLDYLLRQRGFSRIGLIVQADEFGLALEKHYVRLLHEYGISPVVRARFRRNTNDVEQAFSKIQNSPIEALLLVGTYQPLSNLIALAHKKGVKPVFTGVSFTSSEALLARLSGDETVLITEVVPNPKNCDLPVCEEFRQRAKQSREVKVNHVEFEGYLNAKLLTLIAAQCDIVDRDCIDRGYRSNTIDLGGLVVKLDQFGKNTAAKVYMTGQNIAPVQQQ